jgi:hypothetical protein
MIRKYLIFFMTMCLMAASISLFADGGDDKTRPVNSQEKAWILSSWTKIFKAMPAAPAQWTRSDDGPPEIREVSITSPYALAMNSHVELNRQMGMNMEEMARDTEDMNAGFSEMQPLIEKMQAAAARGDQKEIERIRAEMERIQSGNRGMRKMKARNDEAEMGSARIDISVNANGWDIDGADLAAPQGVAHAVISGPAPGRGADANSETRITLFIGRFTKKGGPSNWQIYCPVTKGRITSLQTIIVTIVAKDDQVARDLMKRMNTKALSSMLDR